MLVNFWLSFRSKSFAPKRDRMATRWLHGSKKRCFVSILSWQNSHSLGGSPEKWWACERRECPRRSLVIVTAVFLCTPLNICCRCTSTLTRLRVVLRDFQWSLHLSLIFLRITLTQSHMGMSSVAGSIELLLADFANESAASFRRKGSGYSRVAWSPKEGHLVWLEWVYSLPYLRHQWVGWSVCQ